MRIRVSPQADQDLDEIEQYIGNDNPMAAARFVARLVEQFQRLADSPRIGRLRHELGPELRSIAEGSYVIFYRIVGKEIVRVLHGKRNMQKILMSGAD
jgi:toxin ParE1/3/4